MSSSSRMHFARAPLSVATGALILACALNTSANAADTSVQVSSFYDLLKPYIADTVGALITFGVGWLLVLARTKMNLSIDDSMRDALQTALKNGAGLALNALGNSLDGKSIDVKNEAVAAGVRYALGAAPAAIAYFNLTPEALAQKITAWLPQIANTTTSTTAAT